jgi:hypothetical protein
VEHTTKTETNAAADENNMRAMYESYTLEIPL